MGLLFSEVYPFEFDYAYLGIAKECKIESKFC